MSTARLPLLVVAAVLLVPVLDAHGETFHSDHVIDVHHAPDPPPRGRAVQVQMQVAATNVSEARLIYCRVQHYACGPAVPMQLARDHFLGDIPWTKRFFRDVTTVGYRMEIEFHDGTVERTPVQHYPYRPVDLVAEADVYYYYTLPEESPSLAAPLLLVLLFAVAVMRR